MPNEILEKFGTSTALTISLGGLVNVAGRVSTQVDNTAVKAGAVIISYKITIGAAAPTAGRCIEFYLARGDTNASAHVDGGLADTDTGYTSASTPTAANLRSRLQLVGVQPVTADATTVYQGSFVVPNPGPKWSIYVFNDLGQTIDADDADHYVRYQTVVPEVQ